MTEKPVGGWLMIGGGAAQIIGAFLPWVKASAPLIGTLTKAGTDDGSDGWFLVVFGAVAVLLGVLYLQGKRTAWPAIVFGVLAVAVMVFEFADVSSRIDDMESESDLISADFGVGMYLCAAGAVATLVGGIMGRAYKEPGEGVLSKFWKGGVASED